MIRLSEKIRVHRSAQDCFRYLQDFSTTEQWDPGVYRAEKLSAGELRSGSEFKVTLQLPGQRPSMLYTLLDATAPTDELPGKIRLKGHGAGIQALDEISIEDKGDHTEIHYLAELRLASVPSALEWTLKPWMSRMGRKAVNGLKAALEPAQSTLIPSLSGQLGTRLIAPAALNFTERGYLNMPNKGLSRYMDDKTVVITGPTSGLGLAAACELARLGAQLILVGRDPERLKQAAEKIHDFSPTAPAGIRLIEADLLDTAQTRAAAQEILHTTDQIDVLINNAGALFAEHQSTQQGHERALAINLLAPALMTETLLPKLAESKGRVINVASGGMYLQAVKLSDMQYLNGRYDGAKAYARAKRALVSLTQHWAQQHPEVSFHAMHPGWAATPGVAKSLPKFNQALEGRLRDARMGADTIVWLATEPKLEAHSGSFWFDRRKQPTAVLPGTAVTPQEQAELIRWLKPILDQDQVQAA